MKLNSFEKWIVTHPLRAWFHHHVDGKILFNMGGGVSGSILEIGCGYGTGIDVIKQVFQGERIDAMDLDHEMVDATSERHKEDDQVRVFQADVFELDTTLSYNAIFDFAVLHHIPDWQGALKVLYNQLAPGGRIFIEEFYKRLICNSLIKSLVEHPQDNRFNHEELIIELKSVGFKIIDDKALFDCVGLIVACKD